MNKKKIIMSTMLVLSITFGGLVGCSNQTSTTQITQNNKKAKTLGTKSAESKSLKVTNKTGKPITVFEVKLSSDDSFGENLLAKGDVIKKGEKRVLYYETKDEDTLSIKVGLKDSDSAFTFDKVDETEKIQNVEISLNKENKVELTVNKKDDSKITIEASADETKTEGEKQNDEASESTAKTEDSKTDSNESKSETKTDKIANSSNSPKSENKSNNSSNINNSNSNKNNSSSSSGHTHKWVAQTKVVHHDEVGHNEQVLVQQAYDEQVPHYEMVAHDICSACGKDLTYLGSSGVSAHLEDHMLNDENGGYYTSWIKEITSYENVHHDAQYKTQYVIEQQAYDETVTTGYKCSSCGATK